MMIAIQVARATPVSWGEHKERMDEEREELVRQRRGPRPPQLRLAPQPTSAKRDPRSEQSHQCQRGEMHCNLYQDGER